MSQKETDSAKDVSRETSLSMFNEEYDIIVVGAGHAGSEAAAAAANMGSLKTLPHYDESPKHCTNVLQSSHGRNCEGSNNKRN